MRPVRLVQIANGIDVRGRVLGQKRADSFLIGYTDDVHIISL